MQLAPIALFVYNRPEHTKKTLEHLSQCDLANESELYVFADGAKSDSNSECLDNIARVRQIIADIKCPKYVKIIEREKNIGLAKSIVTGVTELCRKFGRVIVLEDDLIVGRFFLTYMNSALEKYKDNSNVYQVSGYMFPVRNNCKSDAFFLPLITTWGWGTWDRAWEIFDWNPVVALEKLNNIKFRKKFDINGSYPYSKMLQDRLNGKNDSWGILWWWAVFNKNGLTLFPKYSHVNNSGFDGSGIHCTFTTKFNVPLLNCSTSLIFPSNIIANPEVYEKVSKFFRMDIFKNVYRSAQQLFKILKHR